MPPIALDYDTHGNCIGGHAVSELPKHHLQHYHPPAGVMAQQALNHPAGPQDPPPPLQGPPHAVHQHQLMLMPPFNPATPPAHAPFIANMPQQQYAPFHPQTVETFTGAMLAPRTDPASFRRPSAPHFEPLGLSGPPPPTMNGGPAYGQCPQYHAVGYWPQGPPGAIRTFHTNYQPHHPSHPPWHRNTSPSFRTGSPAPRVQDHTQNFNTTPTQHAANWEPLPFAHQMPPAMPLTEHPRLYSMLTQQDLQQNLLPPTAPQPNVNSWHFGSQQLDSQPPGPQSHLEHDRSAPAPVDLMETDMTIEGTAASSNDFPATIDPKKIDSNANISALQDSADHEMSSLDLEPSRTLSSTTEQDEWMEKASSFVTQFNEHFEKNLNALARFEVLCKNYMKDSISEVDFYVGVRNLLARDNALHLMPGFQVFLPALWKDVDLAWLNKAVEFDREKEKHKAPSRQDDVSAQTISDDKPKKKRPMNGFSASDVSDASSRRQTVDIVSPPPSPVTSTAGPVAKGKTKAEAKVKANIDQAGLVKLPIKQNGLATDGQPVESSQLKTGQKGNHRFGHLLASQVEHFGPVYPSRRAVLQRESKPYVHGCGLRFTHPQDVRKHHDRKAPGCLEAAGLNGEESQWDDHPSCKADYPSLQYTQVKDGFIILDQESYDWLERCVQTGLQYCAGKGLGTKKSARSIVKEGLGDTDVDEKEAIKEDALMRDVTERDMHKKDEDKKNAEDISSDDELEVVGLPKHATKPGHKISATSSTSRKRAASTSAGPGSLAKKPSLAISEKDADAMARAAAFGLRVRK